jgi:STE24 endopeptidase
MTKCLLLILLAAISDPAQQNSQATKGNAERVEVPEPSAQAMDYYRSGNLLWIVARATDLAIPALVLLSGLSLRMRNFARKIGRYWYFTVLIYFVLYCVLDYLLHFPLAFYAGYVRQHAYGFSNQTFLKWLYDSLLAGTLALAFAGLLIWVPYKLITVSPRRWWLYTALLYLPVMFFVMLVEPIWVDPLFNRFGPMSDKRLETEILALANQAGIENGRVFEVEKSVDTTAVNAYVTGLGSSKRIVLWDTLLAKLDPPEVRVVMAHEMGHYVLNHVLQGLLAGFLGTIVALYLIYRMANFVLDRYHDRLGFDRLSDVASLPLLVLLGQIVILLGMPVGLAFSRHVEHEADRFALELTHDNHSAATAFVRLQTENKSNPRPGFLHTLLRASHPSLAERIEFANDYRPWEHGEPLYYEGLFKSSHMGDKSLDPSPETNTAVVPVPKLENDSYDWYARHDEILESKDRIAPEIVMIGDSITHYWGGLPYSRSRNGPKSWNELFGERRVLNLGFGWDRTQNVLWRLDHGEFDGLHPRLVVLNIGTNNFSATASAKANSPAQVADAIRAICTRVRSKSPETRVIVMGVFPRGRSADDPYRAKISELNRRLADLGKTPGIAFLDIGDKFLTPGGEIPQDLMRDYCHPTEKGYSIWAAALKPLL